MGIEKFNQRRDHFEPEDSVGFSFPCSVCIYRHGSDREMPCVACDHNSNAEPEMLPNA